jgi:ferrous iron transport protein B
MEAAVANFHERISASTYAEELRAEENLVRMLNLYAEYRTARLNLSNPAAADAMNERFQRKAPDLFIFLRPGTDSDAQMISRALRSLASQQVSLRRQIKEEQIESSFLGMIGSGLEPVTQWAGFNWKINVAILSSFVARESSVATIGVLYQQGADDNLSLEDRMAAETRDGGFTPLHALAVIIFFALYPPCLATTIMIKVQTGSYGWMLFSILFPTTLGFVVASAVFTGGGALGLSGIEMMALFYGIVVMLALIVGLYGARRMRPVGYSGPADHTGAAG